MMGPWKCGDQSGSPQVARWFPPRSHPRHGVVHSTEDSPQPFAYAGAMTDRILLINPNTTSAITDKVVAAARALAPDVTFTGVTGRFGARYVASRAGYAIAGHAALDAWANARDAHDAVILACFGDPGLDRLR